MANPINNNDKLNNCLKCIKSCLKPKKSSDYEFVSYEQPEIQRNHNKHLSKITKVQFETIESPCNELKKQKANLNLNNCKLLISNPQFQSTQIEQTIDDSIYFSILSSADNKVSSTMINNNYQDHFTLDLTTSQIELTNNETISTDSTSAFTNSLYFSPVINRNRASINSTSSSYASITDDETSFDSNDFQSVKSSFFNIQSLLTEDSEQLYVCCVPFEAKIQGDLSLTYSERIKLIHLNNEYSLVQNISTKQCGYVPNNCITLLSSFLNQF